MNKTLHLIKKDLRICAWWLLLWAVVCFTHFGLRMYQISFGDTAATSGFWSHLETTDRWDWQALRWLPLLIIPFFMHADPLVKRYAFWKSLPVNRWRLVFGKMVIVIVFFVLLPLVLEIIYLRAAGLSPMLGEALWMWGVRFLPLVVAVTLACFLTPGMLWGLPAAALLFILLGRILPGPRSYGTPQETATVAVLPSQAAGYRMVVDPNSGKVEAGTESCIDEVSRKQRRKETSLFSVQLKVDSLPKDVLIGNIDCKFDRLVLPDRRIELDPKHGASTSAWNPGSLPVQETSRQANDSGLYDIRNTRKEWSFTTSGPFSARVIPVEGGKLEGTVRAFMVRKITIKEMDVTAADGWNLGLERFSKQASVSQGADTFSFGTSFFKPLSPRSPGESRIPYLAGLYSNNGGTRMLAPGDAIAWITHKTLPYGRIVTGSMNMFDDTTRCRALSVQESKLSSREELAPRMAPLAKLRYLEEQSGPENWKLQFVRYELLGQIDIPFSVNVKRPQSLPVFREEGEFDPLGELPPSLEAQLAAIQLPENPSAEDTRRTMVALTELCVNQGDLSKRDSLLVPLLGRMAAAHPEILFEETKSAADRLRQPMDSDDRIPQYDSGFYDSGSSLWQLPSGGLNGYWQRVVNALIQTSKPEDKELFLRYHSPQIDLLKAIQRHGWEQDALPLMQGITKREPVPLTVSRFIARFPSPETTEALLAQIRMGAHEFYRVLDAIDSGLVDGPTAANAAWDTTVERAVRITDVRDAFLLAVKYGVESAPRDLQRIIRSGMLESGSDKNMNQRLVLGMLQALSVRSDCPLKLPEGVAWLEENAFELMWNPVSRRYEKSGAAPGAPWTDPPEALGTWIDPMGVGTFQVDGDSIRMTSRAMDTDYGYLRCERTVPRLMKEVKGDFTAEVTVDFPFQPSPSWNGKDDRIVRNAGLIVEEGRYNFQSIHRNHKGRTGPPDLRDELHRVSNKWIQKVQNPTWKPTEPVRLKLCRHGNWFYTAWKQGDGPWNESEAKYNEGWMHTVRVGPYLCNRLIQPMEAKFTGYLLRAGSDAPQRPVKGQFQTPNVTPTPDGAELKDWGVVSNLFQNGEFSQNGGKLRIRSAPKLNDWTLDNHVDEPAVLQPVTGDFTYEVTVGPAPEQEWAAAVVVLRNSSKRSNYKVGSGTRERRKFALSNSIWPESPASGPPPPRNPIDFKKPLRIRVERTGTLLSAFTRQEGDAGWQPLAPRVLSQWPDDLYIGVAGTNFGPDEAILEFENPVLVRKPNQTEK